MNAINYWYQKWLAEKKKVVELEEQVKTAEDHAYFAGSEAMREKLIKKTCEFIQTNVREYHKSGVFHVAEFIKDLRKHVEE